jgi:hypothetical protein
MSADSVNQQVVGDALKAALDSYMLGSSNPVQAMWGYDIADFEGQSPVVILRYGQVDRTPKFIGMAKAHVWFYYNADVYVVVGDKASPAWTNQLVETRHALIEKKFADFCADQKRSVGVWDLVEYASPAGAIGPAIVGGFKYRKRVVALKARVING